MNRKIKLIWDFRGPAANKTAEHHEKHLKDYIASEKINLDITGHQHFDELFSTTFMIVEEDNMATIRDTLKPHRGEIYTNQT